MSPLSQSLIYGHTGLYDRLASAACPDSHVLILARPDLQRRALVARGPMGTPHTFAEFLHVRQANCQPGAGALCSTLPGHCPTMQATAQQAEMTGRLPSQSEYSPL